MKTVPSPAKPTKEVQSNTKEKKVRKLKHYQKGYARQKREDELKKAEKK